MGNRQCDAPATMSALLMLLALALATAVAAPAQFYEDSSEVEVPQKRAALVLDRILIALQKALHEEPRAESDNGPRALPLRLSYLDTADMSALQRRGQAGGASGRGRVLRCYFNAVTCF